MRIALIGQAAFAERALEVLHSRGEEIVHVFAPPDPPGGRPDPLKTKALALGVPLSQPATFKSDEAFAAVPRARGGIAGDGVRDADRARAHPLRAAAQVYLLSSLAPAAPSRRQRDQLDAHHGRRAAPG